MIYLDTHVVTAMDRRETKSLSRQALAAIDRDDDRRISPIVVLELEYLREINRLKAPAMNLVRDLGDAIGLRICDASFGDVAIQAAKEAWTRDPFDRIIVAQARLAKAILITRDLVIQQNYSRALA